MTIVSAAPRSAAKAAADSPTGPEPWMRTVSAIWSSERSTAAKPVNRPHPPPITSSAESSSGSLSSLTPGFR